MFAMAHPSALGFSREEEMGPLRWRGGGAGPAAGCSSF